MQVPSVQDTKSEVFKAHPTRKRWLFAIAIVIFVAIVVGITVDFASRKMTPKPISVSSCSDTSSGSLMEQALPLLGPTKSAQLENVVTSIKKLPNYQENTNCLYIVTTYYSNIYDAQDAQSYLNLFNKAYSPSSLSPALAKFSSVSSLRANVAAVVLREQQIKGNFVGI